MKWFFMYCLLLRITRAYLLDFSEDIYGQHLVLDLLAFLRPEKKFASIEDLIRQIGMDADTAKNYNGNHWAE